MLLQAPGDTSGEKGPELVHKTAVGAVGLLLTLCQVPPLLAPAWLFKKTLGTINPLIEKADGWGSAKDIGKLQGYPGLFLLTGATNSKPLYEEDEKNIKRKK